MKCLGLAWACCFLTMGCITRDYDYQPATNIPPRMVSLPNGTTPLDRIVFVDPDLSVDGGVSVQEFQVEVRDPNIEQSLVGRVFINFDRESTVTQIRNEISLPADPTAPDPGARLVKFQMNVPTFFPASSNNPKCYRVELVVASGFKDGTNRQEVLEGDVATAVWWVASGPPETAVDMRRCGE